jgi:hypothetical protein
MYSATQGRVTSGSLSGQEWVRVDEGFDPESLLLVPSPLNARPSLRYRASSSPLAPADRLLFEAHQLPAGSSDEAEKGMVKSVEGIYRNGKVELVEPLAEAEGSRVIVTWVHPAEPVDLRERGIDEPQAADLRRRLAQFAEDWDRPEMAAYDELPSR